MAVKPQGRSPETWLLNKGLYISFVINGRYPFLSGDGGDMGEEAEAAYEEFLQEQYQMLQQQQQQQQQLQQRNHHNFYQQPHAYNVSFGISASVLHSFSKKF